jgi:phage shock protein A
MRGNSLLSRFIRLFKAKSNDLLDAVEDPGSTARQEVRELQAEIARTEEATAAVIAEQTLAQNKRDACVTKSREWSGKAQAAMSRGDENLATKAIEYAEREQRQADLLTASLDHLAPRVTQLKARLVELRRKKEDAESEVGVLDARARAAQASMRAARVLGSVGDSHVNFDGVRNKVDRLEAQADAMGQIAADKADSTIEGEFTELSALPLSERIAALASRQGVAPALTAEG